MGHLKAVVCCSRCLGARYLIVLDGVTTDGISDVRRRLLVNLLVSWRVSLLLCEDAEPLSRLRSRWDGINDVNEAVEVVNPIFKVFGVIFFLNIAWLWWTAGQSIWTVLFAWYVSELEVEGEDRDDPAVETGGGSYVGIV